MLNTTQDSEHHKSCFFSRLRAVDNCYYIIMSLDDFSLFHFSINFLCSVGVGDFLLLCFNQSSFVS